MFYTDYVRKGIGTEKINDGCFMLPMHKKCFHILSLNFFTIKLTISYFIEIKHYLFKTLINPCVIYLRSISYLLRNMSGFRLPQCSRCMLFLVWCPNRTFFLRTAIVHYRPEVQCYLSFASFHAKLFSMYDKWIYKKAFCDLVL